MNMRCCLFAVCLLLNITFLSAQTLKGTVTDQAGNPIPNAAVFIREATSGLTIDDKGAFQVTLKAGTYTCEFSSLGYERKTEKVTVAVTGTTTLRVVMDEKIYQLQDVVINRKGEDFAYPVMRKAIAMAPFYLHQVSTYQADAYMKGSIKVEKIPKLLKMQMNDKEMNDMIGKLYVIESQSEMSYTAPDKYDQKVIAYKNSMPQDLGTTDAASVLTMNIYDPDMMERISPLSPGAFSYYNFRFEGLVPDGVHMVNKIQVIPKKKNGKLMTGWLYIIEDTWNVQYADLAFTEMGVTIRYRAHYNEVQANTFLPTTYDMDLKVNIMGIKASGKYYASLQYNNVTVNEAQGVIRKTDDKVSRVVPPSSQPKTAKQQKAEQQLEQLVSKESLTTREAYKLSRLMQESVEPETKKKERESLEIKPGENEDVRKTVDSLATRRDSIYWEGIRKAPLSSEELISFQRKDSMQPSTSDSTRRNSITIGIGSGGGSDSTASPIGTILMGYQYPVSKKAWVGFDGLLRAVPEYNFVDGFWIGQRFSVGYNPRKHTSIVISPSVYYTTARKTVNWYVDGVMKYAPLSGGELHVSGGRTTADFNRNGMLRVLNSFSSFFFGENPLKLYEKRFIEAENRIDIANGLRLTTGFRYEDRKGQYNHTSFSVWGTPEPNLPMPDHQAAILLVQAEYTPRYRYYIRDGRKTYADSKYPTFMVRYERGLSVVDGPSSTFDLLQLSIRQHVAMGMFDRLTYAVNAGKFFQADHMYFPDAKHFNTNPLFITERSLDTSFSLLDNYAWSTGDLWAQGHLTWESNYLLLKRISFLQTYLFSESLHLHSLYRRAPGTKCYSEAGYSIGLDQIGRVGVFVGFEGTDYKSVGVTISLPLLHLLEHK